MAISILQALYITAFAVLFERSGFRWRWFGPLAGAFIAVVLLAAFITGTGLSTAPAAAEDRMLLASAFMYVIFCPIHAFITVGVMKRLPRGEPFYERLLVKVLAYGAAAFAAGAVFAIVSMAAVMLYTLLKR